jgi:threonine dehydrogenase-like Zn-dependent dehydrogenase
MCRNGRYTERGIKDLDGYASETWTVEPGYAVPLDTRLERVGTLLEPTSVVAKAWDQIERIGSRSWFEPERVLVTGAGPIGLLAALLGRQRGLDVHVLDVVRHGLKPELVEDLGATYHCDGFSAAVAAIGPPEVVVEATGVPSLVLDAVGTTQHYGIVCLTGISSAGRTVSLDAGDLNRSLVLENDVVVGSVNANLDHYAQAAQALAAAELPWLERLISRRLPLASFREAFRPEDDDIKVVLDLTR